MTHGSDPSAAKQGTPPDGGAADAGPAGGVDPLDIEPTQAELDAWADRERRRREAWLQGPTDAERRAYARRERERRLAELEGDDAWVERARLLRRTPREMQLMAEGAVTLLVRWTRRAMAELSEAGRAWEEEGSRPSRRRRVRLDDDAP